MERVFLGLGSNLGDRLANLRSAVDRLQDGGVDLIRSSSVYETDPVGGPSGQARYLNAVVEVATLLDPHDLLAVCKRIESDLGRRPAARWGPRPIDIDILLWGDMLIRQPDLEVPHPEMANRAFVMVPLDEIAPEMYNVACESTVHELTLQLRNFEGVERISGPITVAGDPG